MHLLFTGLGAGNIGDEAMFNGFVGNFPLPAGSTVEVFDVENPVVNTLPACFRYVDWRDEGKCRQAIDSCQAVLLVCGTPVTSELGIDWPLRFLAHRLDYCHGAGLPVHAVAVGVDDLSQQEARDIFRQSFLPIASWTVRSRQCQQALLHLNVPQEKIAVAADYAWLFAPEEKDVSWARQYLHNLGVDLRRPLLGVNVVNEKWPGPTEVKQAIATALDKLVRDDQVQVAFFCNESREGDYFDAQAARETVELMTSSAFLVPNTYFTPSQMIGLLSCCQTTLSQRLHFTILSVLADTPVVSFARGQKMMALLAELGHEPVGTMEECDAQQLLAALRRTFSASQEVVEQQKKARLSLQKRAEDNAFFITNLTPVASEKSFALNRCRNILLPRFDTFGDIVLLQGFVQSLLDILPQARITLLVRQGYEQLTALFPNRLQWRTTPIDVYVDHVDSHMVKSLLEDVKAEEYDTLISTTFNRPWLDDLLGKSLQSAFRIALDSEHVLPDFVMDGLADLDFLQTSAAFDHYMPVEKQTAEQHKYQLLWQWLNDSQEKLPVPALVVPFAVQKQADAILAHRGLQPGEYCLVFPAGSANISLKSWPIEEYARVIADIEKKYRLKVLVAGHIGERQIVESVCDLAHQQGAEPLAWCGDNGELALLCGLMQKSLLYLGNDTGPMHMAAALGKPVVAVFGGGTWPRFIPLAQSGRVYVLPLPCFDCNWHCFKESAPCLSLLTADTVLPDIGAFIEQCKRKSEPEGVDIIEVSVAADCFQSLFADLWQAFSFRSQDSTERLAHIHHLQHKLSMSEEDRAARLSVINTLQEKLSMSEEDRAARLDIINTLQEKLSMSEEDRAARLTVINRAQEQLAACEEDRAARLEVIERLNAELISLQENRFVKALHALRLV